MNLLKMNIMHLIVFYLQLMFSLTQSPVLLLSTAIRLNKIFVSYPEDVISERDLILCQERSACNIIHRRFWLPPLLERLCRCPHRNECPWTWSDKDNQTLYLSNRSQLKFCTELTHLPNCTQRKAAILISTLTAPRQSNTLLKNHTALENSDRHKKHSQHRNITISCNCQEPHYWKLKTNTTKSENDNDYFVKSYYCSRLKKCLKSEFCGYIRLDTHSTFYRCSCPKGHMCMTKNRTIYQAEEMLYVGDSYKAFCLPNKVRP